MARAAKYPNAYQVHLVRRSLETPRTLEEVASHTGMSRALIAYAVRSLIFQRKVVSMACDNGITRYVSTDPGRVCE